ncbi:hypothetical protein KQX54_017092 [Cotesia glomerata]|uniref:Uncharacterized protein n=1 Tax=Cotesia glomerata TaxID=32391 RepID=A0AAV7HZU4_COTGL|nr:hypothetical protein KQX54_017092 [Cotesia glomerata]
MNTDRLPFICFNKSVQLYLKGENNIKYNWIAQIANFIRQVNPSYLTLLHNLDSKIWEKAGIRIIDTYKKQLHESINSRAMNSHYLQAPIRNRELNNYYLKCNILLSMKKLIAQIRCACNFGVVIYANNISSKFDPTKNCPSCSVACADTLEHFFCSCPKFKEIRKHLNLIKSHDELTLSDRTLGKGGRELGGFNGRYRCIHLDVSSPIHGRANREFYLVLTHPILSGQSCGNKRSSGSYCGADTTRHSTIHASRGPT